MTPGWWIHRTTAEGTPLLRSASGTWTRAVHRPGDGNIAQSLNTTFFPPGRNDPTARAARKLVGFNDHLPPAGINNGGNDAVVGQVEENGGSVGCDPGRLDQGSSCSRLNA